MSLQTSRDSGFKVGEVSYNGYTFPNVINAKIDSAVVMDSSERVIKYVTYTLSITTVVVSGDNPQNSPNEAVIANLDEIRERLTEPGQALIFNSQGFGELSVNDSYSGQQDIKFGPKPRLLAWEPIGSNKAVRIVWVCETSIPECVEGNPFYANSLMNFEYEVEWGIDESGMTERRIIGEMEIPVRWKGNRVSDTADRFRHLLENIPLLAGYARSHPLINISKDRTVLTFTVLDREIPSDNAFYPGIINMDVDHSLKTTLIPSGGNTGTGGFIQWNSVISGTVEVAPGYPKALAWWAITALVQHRLRLALEKTYPASYIDKHGGKKEKPKIFVLTSLSLTEEIFGRSVSFSVGYMLIGTPKNILGENGLSDMFNPLPTSWVEWNSSVFNTAHNSRGYAQLRHTTADDVKINLCNNNTPNMGSQPYVVSDHRLNAVFKTPCPPKEASYIAFKNKIRIVCDNNVIFHKQLSDRSETDLTDSENIISDLHKTGFSLPSGSQSNEELGKYQVRDDGEYKVILEGYAVRLGYTIPPPGIKSIGNVECVNVKREIDTQIIKSGECPIYRISWRLECLLNKMPQGDLSIVIESGAQAEDYE